MKACDELREEHKVVLLVLKGSGALAAALRRKGDDRRRVGDLLEFVGNFVDRCHHGKEERHLFPMLSARAGLAGPVPILLAEHGEGRRLVRRISAALEADDSENAARRIEDYAALPRAHIAKGDDVLFSLADRSLGEKDQRALKSAFDRLEAEVMGEGAYERYHRMAHQLGG